MSASNAAALELRMIARDAYLLRKLASAMPTLDDRGAFGLAIAPYLAYYVVEAFDWLCQSSQPPELSLFREHDSAVRSIRARVKILDGHREGLDGLVTQLEECERRSLEWFNRSHVGLLGYVKRWLQDDLGLYFLGRDLICTTHVGLANVSVGLPNLDDPNQNPFDTLGARAKHFSTEFGEFIGALSTILAAHRGPDLTLPVGRLEPPGVISQDRKAGKYYPALRERLGFRTPHAAAFTLLVSQVNFVHRWLRVLLPLSEEFHFRVRFLTVHHALAGLGYLRAAVAGDRNTRIGMLAAEILGTAEARSFRKLNGRVRNVIAHYRFKDSSTMQAAGSTLLETVTRISGRATEEIEQLLDTQLDRMSDAFRRAMRDGNAQP